MNQILKFENNKNEPPITNENFSDYNLKKKQNKLNTFLKIYFIFSNIITIFFIYYFISYKISNNKQEKMSQKLLTDFNISTLYNSTNNYTSEKFHYNYDNNAFSFYIIGIIEIPKINITYPIISEVSDEFLKIAPCKFYGPELNENGNVCIAAHNYDNDKFFSKINILSINDSIYIYNLNGEKQEYNVIENFETGFDDTSCINHKSNNTQELTLVTCNNLNNKRIIVKAIKK